MTGLCQVAPTGSGVGNTTIDIVAIHGLGTKSPGTWEFKPKDGGHVVNWLGDDHMLPAAIPEARVLTYDWNANLSGDAPVQTLLGHADNLLALVLEEHGSRPRPIIFIASCFGGLVLAEALNRAAREHSPYRRVLLDTAGIVFLATPFRGSSGAKEAGWEVLISGIMGANASKQLIKKLDDSDEQLHDMIQSFAELMHSNTLKLPVHCFYETKRTELLRRVLPPKLANMVSVAFVNKTKKILVTEKSACLDGVPRQSLGATHSGTNKFPGPNDANFRLVKAAVREFADNATSVITRRNNGMSSGDHQHLAQVTRSGHFMIPFGRNDEFVGRDAILKELCQKIPPTSSKDDCQRTALKGLGGTGKTQIALEAAYRVADEYPDCSIFWVPAIDLASFVNAYRKIGELLELPNIHNDTSDVKKLVKDGLSQDRAGNWLLIIDNADDIDLLFEDGTSTDYLPFSRKGSILFTTRAHDPSGRLGISPKNIIPVHEMSDIEARSLFLTGLQASQMDDDESIKKVLEFLAHLPLAIKQASGFLVSNTNVTVSKYLEFCESNDKHIISLLSRDFEDRHRYKEYAKERNPIASTWLVSFEHISQYYPQAADLLKFMSFLAEKDIPSSLLPSTSELERAEAIGTLKSYAFIVERKMPGIYDMHRLVRLVMQHWLEEKQEWDKWVADVVRHLSRTYPFPRHANRETWTKFFPHGQAVLKFGNVVHQEKAGALLVNVAASFNSLGQYSRAEEIYLPALKFMKEALGEKSTTTLACMHNLAIAWSRQGKYADAEKLSRQTVELKGEVYGKSHASTLASISSLGNALHGQGKYVEAEKLFRQALELQKEVLGKDHPATLESIDNLASALCDQGNYADGEKLYYQAVELKEKVLGKGHPATLHSINNLSNVLSAQGKYAEAEKQQVQILYLQDILGKSHPSMLEAFNILGNTLFRQGKYEEAEKLYRQTMELQEELYGKKHPSTLNSFNNLASVFSEQGRYEEAEKLHRQTLELKEELYGKNHPSTLDSVNNLCLVLTAQGKFVDGEKLLSEAVKVREEISGERHPSTLEGANNLANCLLGQERFVEAEKMYRKTLGLQEEVMGKMHPHTIRSRANLATALFGQEKCKDAEKMYRLALKQQEEVLDRGHPDIKATVKNLAQLLRWMGKKRRSDAILAEYQC